VAIQGEKIAVGANEGNLILCPSEPDSGKSVNRRPFAKISALIKNRFMAAVLKCQPCRAEESKIDLTLLQQQRCSRA